jgi:hypothetical protein
MLAVCLSDTVRQVRAEIRDLKKRNGSVLAARRNKAAS